VLIKYAVATNKLVVQSGHHQHKKKHSHWLCFYFAFKVMYSKYLFSNLPSRVKPLTVCHFDIVSFIKFKVVSSRFSRCLYYFFFNFSAPNKVVFSAQLKQYFCCVENTFKATRYICLPVFHYCRYDYNYHMPATYLVAGKRAFPICFLLMGVELSFVPAFICNGLHVVLSF